MHPIASRPTRAHLHSHALGNAAHMRHNRERLTRILDATTHMLACSHARKRVTQCREKREQGCTEAWKHGSMEAHGINRSMEARMHTSTQARKHGSTHAHIDASMEAWKHGSMEAWKHGSMEACSGVCAADPLYTRAEDVGKAVSRTPAARARIRRP